MWIIDNIIRGLGIMAQITLLGYAFIGLYLAIKSRYKKRKKW
jgi:hypothetical protein